MILFEGYDNKFTEPYLVVMFCWDYLDFYNATLFKKNKVKLGGLAHDAAA